MSYILDKSDIKSLKDITLAVKIHIKSLKKKKPEIIKERHEEINITKMYYEQLESILYYAERVIEKIEKEE